jgi:hypothetical protein
LLLGTIIIKYKDYCERECNLLLSPGFSNFDVINSSDFGVISNSPLPLLVFSDFSVTNSSNSSIISSSPSPLPVFSDFGIINSTKSRFTGNS